MTGEARNLIVGTGPAALSAALELQRLGVSFEVVDLANDLDQGREAAVQRLRAVEPSEWNGDDVTALFPPPKTSARVGVEKRLTFGSDFPYQRPEFLTLATENCAIDVSHGLGGFGNVWGAAMLPYVEHDLRDWPVAAADMKISYENVARFVSLSAEPDRLERVFPIHHTNVTSIDRSEQTETLLRALEQRQGALESEGITVGRARVAVNSSGDSASCRYCGHCLEGCAYGAMFNPRLLWRGLEQQGVKVHKGFYALEFKQHAGGVTLFALDARDHSVRQWNADRLFLGLGAIGTTRLVARSLGLVNKPIRMKDSQYFFFPLLSYGGAKDLSTKFTLAEVFIEILNPHISPNYVHFQVYGLNDIFRQTIRHMLPTPLRSRRFLKVIESRFYLFQGFLHSSESSELELTIQRSDRTRDHLHIRARDNSRTLRVARRAQALLRNKLARFGLIPPFYLNIVSAGRSFHVGSSFPMGSNDATFASDLLGRPSGLGRVHILDAATFPSIPATTITYTAMANADRVVRESHRTGLLQ